MKVRVLCTITQFLVPGTEQATFEIEVPNSFNGLGLADRQTAAFPAIVDAVCNMQARGNNVTVIVANRVGQFLDMTAPFRPTSTWLLN